MQRLVKLAILGALLVLASPMFTTVVMAGDPVADRGLK